MVYSTTKALEKEKRFWGNVKIGATIVGISSAFFYFIHRTSQIDDPSCDIHYHSKKDKQAWVALQKQITPDLVTQAIIISSKQPPLVSWEDPKSHSLIYYESGTARYLIDAKNEDTTFVFQSLKAITIGTNHYKQEEGGMPESGGVVDVYTNTTYETFYHQESSPLYSLRSGKTPEEMKYTVRAAFSETARLTKEKLPLEEMRQKQDSTAEKIMAAIMEHHKMFGCDHGHKEYYNASLFLQRPNDAIPSHQSSWKDYFRW